MLSNLKTPANVVTEALMTRAALRAAGILIVEGQTDLRFWSEYHPVGNAGLIEGGGRINVISAIEQLDQRKYFRGALGLVDDDHDALLGRRPTSPNLVVLDSVDLEGLLLRSPALDRVLHHKADPGKLAAVGDPREAILARGLPFGQVRWLARRNAWKIDFAQLRPPVFLTDEWSLDRGRLLAKVSHQLSCDSRALEEALAGLPSADPWRICHGYDLLEILSAGFRHFGLPRQSMRPPEIFDALVLALEGVALAAEPAVQEIRSWEARNPPFVVLRPLP